ncbi:MULTISPECIES: hypothetical protein [Paraburkholderia]|uniref:magnesium and cobalt transport protein CorA n=1 Tax=Paraburkholderia sp. WSM4179 TaxID=2991073 RepID=UPI000362908E|nr:MULTISPECIES: hypothetical protein [Paraburkholderia]
MNPDGIHKAALLMMSLGEDEAGEAFRFLGPREVQKISSAMAALRNVTRGSIDAVLQDFIKEAETHTYPHHYYNMTAEGILNLFGSAINVERVYVPESTTAIWSIYWIMSEWADGLDENALKEFKALTVEEIPQGPPTLLDRSFVKQ